MILSHWLICRHYRQFGFSLIIWGIQLCSWVPGSSTSTRWIQGRWAPANNPPDVSIKYQGILCHITASINKKGLEPLCETLLTYSPCINYVHSWWEHAFLVRHIPIPGEDESHWNEHPHWEWGCASPGAHILTENRDVPHRECISSPKTHIVYTGCYSYISWYFISKYLASFWNRMLCCKLTLWWGEMNPIGHFFVVDSPGRGPEVGSSSKIFLQPLKNPKKFSKIF